MRAKVVGTMEKLRKESERRGGDDIERRFEVRYQDMETSLLSLLPFAEREKRLN